MRSYVPALIDLALLVGLGGTDEACPRRLPSTRFSWSFQEITTQECSILGVPSLKSLFYRFGARYRKNVKQTFGLEQAVQGINWLCRQAEMWCHDYVISQTTQNLNLLDHVISISRNININKKKANRG